MKLLLSFYQLQKFMLSFPDFQDKSNLVARYYIEILKNKFIDSHDLALFLFYSLNIHKQETILNSLYCFGQADTTLEDDIEKIQLTHSVTKQKIMFVKSEKIKLYQLCINEWELSRDTQSLETCKEWRSKHSGLCVFYSSLVSQEKLTTIEFLELKADVKDALLENEKQGNSGVFLFDAYLLNGRLEFLQQQLKKLL